MVWENQQRAQTNGRHIPKRHVVLINREPQGRKEITETSLIKETENEKKKVLCEQWVWLLAASLAYRRVPTRKQKSTRHLKQRF